MVYIFERLKNSYGGSSTKPNEMKEPGTLSRRSFLALSASAAGAIVTRGNIAGLQSKANDVSDKLKKLIPGIMGEFGCPGLSVAVFEEGEIRWAEGFGVKSVKAKEPVGADTVFEAASLSKQLFATIVLKLAEEQIIDLDAPLGEYFRYPDLRNEPQVDLITPRIVLSHSTGLQNWRPPRNPLKIQFTPGTQFSYSGEAYVRLQRAVEKITGESLTNLSRAYVFDALHMNHSSYVWKDEYEQIAAEGHNSTGEIVRTRLWKYSPDSTRGSNDSPKEDIPLFAVPNAAASLFSTAQEYAHFVMSLINSDERLKFSETLLKLMVTPRTKLNDEISWGLGWGICRVEEELNIWHWGNNGVYQSFVSAVPESRSGIVVLTNSANGLKVCKNVVEGVLRAEHPAFKWSMVLKA